MAEDTRQKILTAAREMGYYPDFTAGSLRRRRTETVGFVIPYITHDLAVARYMCDRIAVMYVGKIVEMGEIEELLHNPKHPYTKALLSAVPVPDPTYTRPPVEIKGRVAKPVDPPPRCRFYDRCPLADEYCQTHDHPPLQEKAPGRYAACYHSHQV